MICMCVSVSLVGGDGSWLCMLSPAGWLPSMGSATFSMQQSTYKSATYLQPLFSCHKTIVSDHITTSTIVICTEYSVTNLLFSSIETYSLLCCVCVIVCLAINSGRWHLTFVCLNIMPMRCGSFSGGGCDNRSQTDVADFTVRARRTNRRRRTKNGCRRMTDGFPVFLFYL